MDTFTSIKVFRQVVDSGSFAKAADLLELSTAMVSKHVMSIEQRLGVRLLNRNSRSLSLTESGRLYFERCKGIVDELQATELELRSQTGTASGVLRLAATTLAADYWLADVLAEFHLRYPQVLVEVSCEDRVADLVETGYDLALCIASGLDSLPGGVIARPLRTMTFYLAASREYIKRRGMPNTPEELAEHEFIAVGSLLDSLPPLSSKSGTPVPLHVVRRYRSMVGVANAIAAGSGIAPVPAGLFEDPLFKDVVVPILPDCPLQEARLYALYVSRRFVPLKLLKFVDFVAEFLGRVAPPEATTDPGRPSVRCLPAMSREAATLPR